MYLFDTDTITGLLKKSPFPGLVKINDKFSISQYKDCFFFFFDFPSASLLGGFARRAVWRIPGITISNWHNQAKSVRRDFEFLFMRSEFGLEH